MYCNKFQTYYKKSKSTLPVANLQVIRMAERKIWKYWAKDKLRIFERNFEKFPSYDAPQGPNCQYVLWKHVDDIPDNEWSRVQVLTFYNPNK